MNHEDQLRLLDIYLDDHWAGAAAGRGVARRLYRNNRRTSWADELRWLSEEIESDVRTLADVRKRLGVDGGRLKRGLAVAGERISRFKPNGRIVSYSPLSRLLEAEAMMAGVEAKRRLWSALRDGRPSDADLSVFDFSQLQQRAENQLEVLRDFHRDAAAMAFGSRVESPRSV